MWLGGRREQRRKSKKVLTTGQLITRGKVYFAVTKTGEDSGKYWIKYE